MPTGKVGAFLWMSEAVGTGAPGGSALSLGGAQAGGRHTCPRSALLPSGWHPPSLNSLYDLGLGPKDLSFPCHKIRCCM